ncbi:armadillo-type protein [Chytriomyces sp. MP71]|nr:armadillo-type protein [Chytriomyces sp. MP71]
MITTNPNQLDSTMDSGMQTKTNEYSTESGPVSCKNSAGFVVIDLHAEISTLKTARQTDAYLLSLRDKEIAELRSLLQAKADTASSDCLQPPDMSRLCTQKINALQASNNDSTETLVTDFSDNPETDSYLLSGLSKICDSPDLGSKKFNHDRLLTSCITHPSYDLPSSDDQVTIGGVDMKRSGGIRFGSLEPSEESQSRTQSHCSPDTSQGFSESDLQCFRSLSIHHRPYTGSPTVLTDISPAQSADTLPLLSSTLQKSGDGCFDQVSPLFHSAESSEVRGPSPAQTRSGSTSDLANQHMPGNIWSQYASMNSSSSAMKFPNASGKDMQSCDMFRQSSLNHRSYLSEDQRSMSRGFADDCNGKFKINKFNLDPTSPAYVPSTFKPQSRVHSVPNYHSSQAESLPKSSWGVYLPKAQTYPEFDDMVGDATLYPIESEYQSASGRSMMTQNPYGASNHIANSSSDGEDHVQYSSEFNEFGDAVQYQLLVEKIIQTNDQPASLHLQQNIKHLSTIIQNPLSDASIVTAAIRSRTQFMDAVRPQALALMRNRFGNFLMQRCLEFGTRDQVKGIVSLMVGHIYPLSCDRFGCHVVQKALDVCEDDIKFNIVSELFRAIPETITHRFACHVWQRVFETKWGTPLSPPSSTALEQFPLTSNMMEPASATQAKITFANRSKIVQRVDVALKGQWHLVANDENGSLVVQCIFENCTDVDKREIVKEVLVYAADIAKGQWGNWVIQHLLDNGTPADKSHIFKVVSRNVYSMSVDQFASKVVEKVLKSCQRRELYDIVDVVISPVMRENGCPGILEMMNNQYANYVVQHILTLSDPSQRDACVRLIAPHLPVLRGSKYGQRVAAIVEKHIRTCQQRFGTIINTVSTQFSRSASNQSAQMFNSNVSTSQSDDELYNNQLMYNGACSGYSSFANTQQQQQQPQPTNPLFTNSFTSGFDVSPMQQQQSHQSLYQQQQCQQRNHQLLQHQHQQLYATSPPFPGDSALMNHMNMGNGSGNANLMGMKQLPVDNPLFYPQPPMQPPPMQFNNSGHSGMGDNNNFSTGW